TVSNAGPDTAKNAVGFVFVDHRVALSELVGPVPPGTTITTDAGIDTLTIPLGDFAAGAAASVSVRARPAAPGTFLLNAGTTSDTPDPSTFDNFVFGVPVTVLPREADLSLTATHSPEPSRVGDP